MAKMLSLKRFVKSSVAALLYVSLAAHAAADGWRTDCVGRLLIDLPSNAAVPGVSYEHFLENVRTPSQSIPYEFPDGQPAPWVRILYKGELAISNPLNAQMRETISKSFLDAKHAAKARIAESSAQGGGSLVFSDVADMPMGSAAWTDGRTVKTLVVLSDRMIIARVSSGRGLQASIAMARDLAFKTSPRELFIIPDDKGVCVPGGYLRVGDSDIRNVGSMYRLDSHPDVTIFVRDANAANYTDPVRERNAEPQQKIRRFWAEYGVMEPVKRLTPLSGVLEDRTIAIGGQDGKASAVRIERADGTVDYGFYVAVRGIPGEVKAPDLELLVVTDGKRARAKGKSPIEKGDFERLSRRIAMSVRLRD